MRELVVFTNRIVQNGQKGFRRAYSISIQIFRKRSALETTANCFRSPMDFMMNNIDRRFQKYWKTFDRETLRNSILHQNTQTSLASDSAWKAICPRRELNAKNALIHLKATDRLLLRTPETLQAFRCEERKKPASCHTQARQLCQLID